MENNSYKKGLLCVVACQVMWGLLPIYWQSLKPIDSFVIIFYRVILMAVLCYVVSGLQHGFKGILKPLFESKKSLLTYIGAGITITINWSLFIWAVNSGFVIQSSMGYFLEPLVVSAFGVIFYKEKLNKSKKIAMGFAIVGILVMLIGYGEVPYIAVFLALTFAFYAAIKKSVTVAPIQSLLYETILLMPIALGFVIYYETHGIGAFAVADNVTLALLFCCGIATAVPLALFAFAAKKLPLVTLGLVEYISPSISLILGVFLFKEPFDVVQFSAFAFIWVGLVFFTSAPSFPEDPDHPLNVSKPDVPNESLYHQTLCYHTNCSKNKIHWDLDRLFEPLLFQIYRHKRSTRPECQSICLRLSFSFK